MDRKGAVLVFETDDHIRALLERWLGEGGYKVRTQESAADPPPGEPVLVIANLPNPDAAGALIRSLRAAYSAPILALSGRFRRGLASSSDAARRLGVRKVLPKPFLRKELLCAVREAIEGA